MARIMRTSKITGYVRDLFPEGTPVITADRVALMPADKTHALVVLWTSAGTAAMSSMLTAPQLREVAAKMNELATAIGKASPS